MSVDRMNRIGCKSVKKLAKYLAKNYWVVGAIRNRIKQRSKSKSKL